MDKLRAARVGFNPKKVEDTSPQDREVLDRTASFLELWGPIKDQLRELYVERLKACGVKDDLQRFRLVESINILDVVEIHAQKVHSDADVNLKKVIKKEFPLKRGFLR